MEKTRRSIAAGTPVNREGFIQNTGIFLVLKQLERAGSDWVSGPLFPECRLFSMLSACSLERIEAEVHRRVSRNGASGRTAQTGQFYRPLFHSAIGPSRPHPFEVFIAAARHFIVRVLGIFPLTVEGEHNVV